LTVRAKFVVAAVTARQGSRDVELVAVTSGSDENKSFWQYTPAGNIKLSVVNEAAAAQFQPGQEYYVDFTPASKAE
jgi:hypothetical protein